MVKRIFSQACAAGREKGDANERKNLEKDSRKKGSKS